MTVCETDGNNVKFYLREEPPNQESCECTVNLFGATVTSWKNRGEEILFCSEKAIFDGKKAIRGGIPVVFPNFGPWDLGPQHGFARIKQWKLAADSSEIPAFTLEDDEGTRKMWNHKFKLEYRVDLCKDSLTTSLTVNNTGSDAFSFTTLLHTYFRVNDISKTRIRGLNGLNFVDKVHGGEHKEIRDLVVIDENYDRVYQDSKGPVEVIPDVDKPSNVRHVSSNYLPDVVVWNPWAEKAKGMADFGDLEYLNMVCVEAGAVSKPVSLQAKQSMTFSQTISVNKAVKR